MSAPGYTLNRRWGITQRERQMLSQLVLGGNRADAAAALGVSVQRIGHLIKALEKKGVLTREDGVMTITLRYAAPATVTASKASQLEGA